MRRGSQGRVRSGRVKSLGPFRVPVSALLVTIAFSVASPADAQLRGPEVTDVRFEGNETFSADSLSRAIATRATECHTWLFKPFCWLGFDFANSRFHLRDRDLPRDRVRLILWYQQRGFREVLVDTATVARTAENAVVTFTVTEGRPVVAASVDIVGAEVFEGSDLLDDLPMEAGDRLSTHALDATRDTIIRRLSNRGYAYAEVFRAVVRPAEDLYNAVVTFDVVPGPATTYGSITVNGTGNLGVGTVLRTAQLTSGDPYRRDELDDARGRLYGLDIIRNARVEPDTASLDRDPVVDVEITIQEGDAYRVRAGGGWNMAECFNIESRWTARNFMGGGRVLQLRGRLGNLLASQLRDPVCEQSGEGDFAALTGLFSVDFVQPRIFSTRNALSVSFIVEKQSLPDVFIRRAVGAQVGLSRTVSPQTILTGFYRPEISELDAPDVLFCTGFLVCSPDDIADLEGANWLSPVGLNLSRDRADDLLNPRSGYRLLFDVEHAAPWTGSDFRYDRMVVEAARYERLGGTVFATRVRGGWVGAGGFDGLVQSSDGSTDIVHPQKRFYSGGANSVRGFAQSRLGPRVLFSEPQTLLSGGATGAGCTEDQLVGLSCSPASEAGLTPQPTGGTRLIEANAELRFPITRLFEGVLFTDVGQVWGPDQSIDVVALEFTPGVGVRIPSPVGPIRVDVAYRFRGAQDLSVVTERIRPFDAMTDIPEDRLTIERSTGPGTVRETTIPWVSTGELVFLNSPFLFGRNDKGLQLHVSIGQAF